MFLSTLTHQIQPSILKQSFGSDVVQEKTPKTTSVILGVDGQLYF